MSPDPTPRTCPVCKRPFPPRRRAGGQPKEHCSDACRIKHWSAFRALGESLVAGGTYSIGDALRALEAKEALAAARKRGEP